MAESSKLKGGECPVFTASGAAVHRLVTAIGRAVPPSLFTREHQKQRGTAMVTAMGATVHRSFYLESREIRGGSAGWSSPPCPVPQQLVFSHWNSIVGQVTAMSGAKHRPVR